jgi:hypothetical protein
MRGSVRLGAAICQTSSRLQVHLAVTRTGGIRGVIVTRFELFESEREVDRAVL